jgi:hypothetical protein
MGLWVSRGDLRAYKKSASTEAFAYSSSRWKTLVLHLLACPICFLSTGDLGSYQANRTLPPMVRDNVILFFVCCERVVGHAVV